MLTITVAQNGSGDFATIGEAVLAVPYDTPAEILIGPGTYREKLACEKRDITLRGAGMAETRLVWNDGGKLPHPDGRPTHTFRSWTAFFSGQRGQPGHAVLRPPARAGAGEGRLSGPAGVCPPAAQRPVLPGLRDHRRHRLHLRRGGRPV